MGFDTDNNRDLVVSSLSNLLDKHAQNIVRKLWDRSLIGIGLLSEDGRFLRANNALCRMLEFTEFELQQKTFQDITHPDDTGADIKMAKRVSSGQAEEYEMFKKYLSKNNSIIHAHLFVAAIEDENGKFICFLSQIVEINPVKSTLPAAPPDAKLKKIAIPTKWYLVLTSIAFVISEIAFKMIEYFEGKQ